MGAHVATGAVLAKGKAHNARRRRVKRRFVCRSLVSVSADRSHDITQGDRDQGQDQHHEKPARQKLAPIFGSPRIAELPSVIGTMFCFDRCRYIARHSRLMAIRLRRRSFCTSILVVQHNTGVIG